MGYSKLRTLEYDAALAEELLSQGTEAGRCIPIKIGVRLSGINCWENKDL
jgi:hypothetical protein